MAGKIEHKGIVDKVEGGRVTVSFLQQPACSGCHAKSICTVPGNEEGSSLDIHVGNGQYSAGEEVIITLEQSKGVKALMIGYVYPLIIVLTTLVAMLVAGTSELVTGVTSIGILVPYYLLVFFFREKINKEFVFTINRIAVS